MSFGSNCGGVGGFLGENCEILFFILVFLLLFWNGFRSEVVDP
ncbi:MAG: hypothetical protein Q8942_03190 [Bacillota bacterium]|nr:hypothetical protein [Bacillota bacterium]